jgi:hypothetical protein
MVVVGRVAEEITVGPSPLRMDRLEDTSLDKEIERAVDGGQPHSHHPVPEDPDKIPWVYRAAARFDERSDDRSALPGEANSPFP